MRSYTTPGDIILLLPTLYPNYGCSIRPLPHKLEQKPNQILRYDTVSALRKTLTTENRRPHC
jgi:hypothetical protein